MPGQLLSHLPLLRIGASEAAVGRGRLVALPFETYDDLILGAFSDSRRAYIATAPVFFATDLDDADHSRECS